MHKVKQFMNKITDKSTADPSSGVVQTMVEDQDGQVSAEGFLCPDCMTAFASPESLGDHYSTMHSTIAGSEASSDAERKAENELLAMTPEQQELVELRTALESERKLSTRLERYLEEVLDEVEGAKNIPAVVPSNMNEQEINSLKEECLDLRRQVDDWKLKYEDVNRDLKSVRESSAEEKKVLNESLVNLKQQFLEIQNKATISEGDCTSLKAEVQRLREQLADLVRGFEGDDGLQTAIESLTKERNALLTNVDSLQIQNRELSKDVHNVGLDLNKLRVDNEILHSELKDYKLKAETDIQSHRDEAAEKDRLLKEEVKANNRSKSICESLQTQVLNQSQEIKGLKTKVGEKDECILKLEKEGLASSEQITTLTATVEKLRKEVSLYKEQAASGESKIEELQNLLAKSTEKANLLEKEKSSLQIANGAIQNILEEQSRAFSRYLADVSSVLGIKQDFDQENKNHANDEPKESDYDTYQKHSNAIVKGMSEKIVSMKENQRLLQNDVEKVKEELIISKEQNQKFAKTNEQLAEDLKSQKQENETAMELLRKELEDDRKSFDEKLKSAKKVEEQVLQLKEQIGALEGNAKRFQDERDNLQAERLELDKKYKSSEEARALLMDRCLVSESESEKFNETIQGLQRKLADALAALQELGRENQSLQVESAKLQGRKWTDDSNVSSCSACSKEFSITIRKHHCRVCGNIFCHECSARTASIPSCKKPVRVCDTCASDISK